jgi:ribosomal protein S18 acetylase RimI-like enzyme
MTRLTIQRVDYSTVSQETIQKLADLINFAYNKANEGTWPSSWRRTSTSQIAQMISHHQIRAAYLDSTIIGTIRLQTLQTENGPIAELGLLAVAPEARGTGAGNALVQYVEHEAKMMGLGIMQLEVLVPREMGEIKHGLVKYYRKLGYVRTGYGELDAAAMPEMLMRRCDYVIFHKVL